MSDSSNAGKQFQRFVIGDRNNPDFGSWGGFVKYPSRVQAESDILVAQAYAHANGKDVPDLYVREHDE
jgi:hypothetical protein